MQINRQSARDDLALWTMNTYKRPKYDHTRGHVLKRSSQIAYFPLVVGILEDTSQQ